MNLPRASLVLLAALGLGALGLPVPGWSQTIYAPYKIATMSTLGTSGAPLYVLYPVDVCVDQATNIYVAGYNDHTIRKITTTDGTNWTIALFAGAPNAGGSTNGPGTAARFTYPVSVVTDSHGNVFVADAGNFTIRKITPAGEVTTFAGEAGDHDYIDGPGNAARFAGVSSLACDTNDNLYVADYGNRAIRKITPGAVVSTIVAGPPSPNAEFGGGIAVDAAGNVFHASPQLQTIRKITPGGTISTIAGLELAPGYVDSTNSTARFHVPNDIAVDALGNLYVTEAGSNTIRKISPVGSDWVVRTMAGLPGVADDNNGTGAAARFNNPGGIAIDRHGKLYITDFLNGLIRTGIYDGPTNDFNSWTNSGPGKWEGSNYWSVGQAPSVQDQVNYLTNAGTKAVLIDEATPLATLTVNNLLVSAPPGDINGLVLFDSGPAKPLQVKETLAIDSGGIVALTNASLQVSLNLGVGIDKGAAVLDLYSGGKVVAQNGYVGYEDSGANAVSVNGPTSAWTNQNSFVLGYSSTGNGVLVENGATMVNQGTGVIGQGGDNNALVVTGTGSTFRNAGTLFIGADEGNGNSLTVVNGGAAHVGYTGGAEMRIGDGGDGNEVTVSDPGSVLNCSGPLRLVDNVSSTYNALYIGNGASVTTPSLTVSNGNFVGLAGGTLNTAGTIINNGTVFPVGVGTHAATLRLNGGTHTFADGLVVTDHAVLSGCGTIVGPVTIEPGGTVLADCGALIFTGPVTNNGTIQPLYGTNVIFQNIVINRGSILTNLGAAMWTCPIVVTGAIVNLNDSATTTITDGTNSVQFNWSLAGPGASGYIYTTANTAIAAVTNVISVSQITNAVAYTFLTSGNVGPLKDAGANGGNAQFVLLRNKTTGHYCAVRMDDVQANGRLNASWWFQSQSGQTNFGCVPPLPPPGPLPATNFTMQATGGYLSLSFATQVGRAHTIQVRTNLTTSPWISLTNFPGDGTAHTISLPINRPEGYYRILTQ